jgi:Chalcone isomerase-like
MSASIWLKTAAIQVRLKAAAALTGVVLMAFSALPAMAEAQAATLEGQRFDDTTVLAERTLRLNGLGLRGVAWIKAFVAGLYLSAPSKDSAQVLAMPGPKRLRLKIMLSAPSHELTKSLTARIDKYEAPELKSRMATRITTLAAMIDGLGDLKSGDVIDLDYTPDVGIGLRFNDRTIGKPVPGDDLYRAVLKIFVGDHPIDKRLKAGLLGGNL